MKIGPLLSRFKEQVKANRLQKQVRTVTDVNPQTHPKAPIYGSWVLQTRKRRQWQLNEPVYSVKIPRSHKWQPSCFPSGRFVIIKSF